MATAAKATPKSTKAKPASAKTATKAAVKPAAKPAEKPATKPVAAKTTAKTAVAKAASDKPAAKSKQAKVPTLTPEQRRGYVAVAAYYIAERRGFHGGSEFDDWVQAEAEIDRLLQEGVLKP